MPIPKNVISELRSLSTDESVVPEKVELITGARTVDEILRTAPEIPATTQALAEAATATAPVEDPVEAPTQQEVSEPTRDPSAPQPAKPTTLAGIARQVRDEDIKPRVPTLSVSPGAPPPGVFAEDIQAKEKQFRDKYTRVGVPLKTEKEIGPSLPKEGFGGFIDRFTSIFEVPAGAPPAGFATGRMETLQPRLQTVAPSTLRMQLGTLPSAESKAKALTSFVKAQGLDPEKHPVRVADMGRVIVPFKNPQGTVEDILLDSPAFNATDLQDLVSDAVVMLGSGGTVKLGSAAFPKLVSFAPKGASAFAGTALAAGLGTTATRTGLLSEARETFDLPPDLVGDLSQSLSEAGVETLAAGSLAGIGKIFKAATSPIQAATSYFKKVPGYEERLARLRESLDNLSAQLGVPVEDILTVGELTNDPRLLSIERYVSDQGGGGVLAEALQRSRELKYTLLEALSSFPSKGIDPATVDPVETATTAMWKRLGELDDAAVDAKTGVIDTAIKDVLDRLHKQTYERGLGSKTVEPGKALRSFVNGVRSTFRKKRDDLYKQVNDRIKELARKSPEIVPGTGVTEYDQIVKSSGPLSLLESFIKPAKVKQIVTRRTEELGYEVDPSGLFNRQVVEAIESDEAEERILMPLLEGFYAKYSTIFNQASQGMSIETADLIRKELNDDIGSLIEKPFAKKEQMRLSQLKAALDKELDLAADRIQDPSVRQLMKDANSFYAKNIEKFQTAGAKKLFNFTANGQVRMPDNEIIGQLIKSPDDYKALKLFSKDYPQVWSKVQRSMLDKLVSDSGVGGTLDLIQFQQKLTSLPESTRKDLLGASYDKTIQFLNKLKPKDWLNESIYVPKSLFNEWITWTEMAGRKAKLGPPPSELQSKMYDAASKSIEASTTFSDKLVKPLRERGGVISIEQLESAFPEGTFVKTLLDTGSESDVKFILNNLSDEERQKLAQLSLEELFHRSNYAATQRAIEKKMDIKDSAINGSALSEVLSQRGMDGKLRLLLGEDTYRLVTDFETYLRRGEVARQKAGNPGSSLSKGEDIAAVVETKFGKLATRARYWLASQLLTSPLFKAQALKPLRTTSPKWDFLSYGYFAGPQFGSALEAASGDDRAAGFKLLSDLIPEDYLMDLATPQQPQTPNE